MLFAIAAMAASVAFAQTERMVMAGCKPEYMPILIAMTKAIGAGDFRRTLASTHAWQPYCWINGPIAKELGIDNGQGEINEEANVCIGRFMNLALMNLAGYYVKQCRTHHFTCSTPSGSFISDLTLPSASLTCFT